MDAGIFRMAIDRAFTVAGHGTVVTGTVVSGRARVGDELEWLPARRRVRVRGLHRHDRPVEQVQRGTRRGDQPGGGPSRRGPPGRRDRRARLPRAVARPVGRSGCVGGIAAGPPASRAVQGAPRHRGGPGRAVAAGAGRRRGCRGGPGLAATGPGAAGRAGGRGARPAVCPAPRARPRRSAAAGCSSRPHADSAAANGRRSSGCGNSARPSRWSGCARC